MQDIDKAEVMQALRTSDVFEGLTDAELEQVADIAFRKVFHTGEHLCCQGERSEYTYVILSGTVGHFVQMGDVLVSVKVMGPGSLAGLMALLDSPISLLTCKAVSEVTTLAIPRREFAALVDRNCGIFHEVAKRLALRLARMVRLLYETIAEAELHSSQSAA